MPKMMIAIFALLAILLTACAPASTPTPPLVSPTLLPATQPPASSGNEGKITINNFKFDPASVTVKTGTTITWTNQDSTKHTVTSDDGSWTSAELSTGATFSFTFDKAGTYTYHCSIHTSMKGTIIVQ